LRQCSRAASTPVVTVTPVQVRSLSTLLAALPGDAGVAVVRDGDQTVIAVHPTDIVVADGDDAFRALDRIEQSDGFWVGFCAYDLGRVVEPVAARAVDDRNIPDLAFARFDARLVVDPSGVGTIIADDIESASAELLRRAAWQASRVRSHRAAVARQSRAARPRWESSLDRSEHEHAVELIREHLEAGDCYQVNLTRRLTHARAIDPTALFCALWEHNPAPHSSLIRFGTRGPALAIVGASPELFLGVRGEVVTTRPIKGTHRSAQMLLASEKDAAEHVMIVDLARNDLGRVCVAGTIEVAALMELEAHPGLHHLVSTIVGTRRNDATLGAVVRALLPAASITGAPKPAVMQIIEDLEPVRRGVYCGATGWIDPAAGRAELAVAIRTFTITARHTDLGVGGGIVADSRADNEWDETELKAHRLLEATLRNAASADTAEGHVARVWP
jgi:para-aminobenzoate synthetase component 1